MIHGSASTFGIFFTSLQSEFGWSRTLLSGVSVLGSIVWGFMAIAAGRLTDRFGPRPVIIVFCLIMSAGYILMSRAENIWQVFLFLGIFTNFGNGSADVTLLSTTARWFTKRRGIMSGIIKVGTGTGLMIFPIVIARLIQDYTWRDAYLIIGIASFIVIMLIAQFLKRDPSQKGLQPYGSDDTLDFPRPATGLSLREAFNARQFWLTDAVFFLCVCATQTVIVHIVPHALDNGLSTAQSAGTLSIIGGVSIVSRLVVGAMGDCLGHRRVMTLNLLVLSAALSWLLVADTLFSFYLFAVIYGYAHGSFFATISPLVAEIFGMRAHGALLGMLIFLGWIGHALGPLMAGRVFDVAHSYQLAFIVILTGTVLGLLLSTLLKPVALKH